MNHLMIFSAVFLIVASMSLILGYFALSLDFHGYINRVFMMISFCLMVWALGFSIVIIAPNEASAVFWTRISAIGYELIYSLLLHYTLIITGAKQIITKKWFLALIYLPAMICLYVFVLSDSFAHSIYLFANTNRGWVRTTPPFFYDTLFNVYYILAVIASIILLFRWKQRSADLSVKKQANILIVSFFIAFGLGTITDVVNGLYWNLPIPPMAPILFLIPLSAIFYSVEKYHFMKPRNQNKLAVILNDEKRSTAFKTIANAMLLVGMLLFAMPFIFAIETWLMTIVVALLLMSSGGFLRYVQLVKGYNHLESMVFIISVTQTPMLIIYMGQWGTPALWAFPVCLIIFALVFNSNHALVSAVVPVVIGQIYLAGSVPSRYVVVDYQTYGIRIFILLIIMAAAYYIHRIYLGRLRENAEQTRTQTLISDLATGFSLTEHADMIQQIHELLYILQDYFMADTVLIYVTDPEVAKLLGIQRYSLGDEEILEEKLLTSWEFYLASHKQQQNQSLLLKKHLLQERMQQQKTVPWVVIPLYKNDKEVAFFYIETKRKENIWTKDQLVSLPIISRIVSDALEKVSSEAKIRFMAYYDSLTKLPNRQLFYDRAEQAIHLARRNNTIVGILFLDLDSFKSINDTMGHEGGDLLIQAIGRKLAERLRRTDTVARFGGDEFLVLMNAVQDIEGITKAANKIMSIFQESVILKGQEIFITASAGISIFPVDGEDSETLIKHADIAMYNAKEMGKNQYAFCSTNMKETVKYRVNLTNHLYRALERNEFQIYYQPQVDLQTEQITGVEALLRWVHPKYGMISPSEFISLAEQTGLINAIGSWVLETACQQVMEWQQKGYEDLRIAVNLSVIQLRDPELLPRIKHILDKVKINPGLVELEITESTTTREPDYIIGVLNELKQLGVMISIDDFGTEYSSLNRLKQLPVDKIKMDIQFVHGIGKSQKDQAISLVIINLAKNLDLRLVAEGVETSSQIDFLRSRMCDEVQGFYYYKPMPAAEMNEIFERRRLL